VAPLARDLAIAAGCTADLVELITIGAHLHDIGKIVVPRDILNAARKLSPDEMAQIQLHTSLGWALVEQAGFETVICEIVRHHHERYDGNGYPDRLQGEGIPIGARVVGIADSYEALTSARTYRSAYTPPFAMSYMKADRGRVYDPNLLDLFFTKVIKDP